MEVLKYQGISYSTKLSLKSKGKLYDSMYGILNNAKFITRGKSQSRMSWQAGELTRKDLSGVMVIFYIFIGTVLYRYRHTSEIITGSVPDHYNKSKYCNKASEMNFFAS